jgi:hypothetical protein
MRCPKCAGPVSITGTATLDGQELDVYQCDDCTVPWTVGTLTTDVALTFAVDADGRFYDPTSGERLNVN